MSGPRDDMHRSPKVWLVTGCSTGFGRSIVQAIIALGDKVIATARKTSDLTYIGSSPNVRAIQLDVTAADHVIQQKIKETIAAFGKIDILVNNAGYVLSGVWEEVRYVANALSCRRVHFCSSPDLGKLRIGRTI